MEQVLAILQVISAAVIVPLIGVIKQKWIPPEWAFSSWVVQLMLSFGIAAGLMALMVDVWTWQEVWQITLTIMAGASAIHAGAKTYHKKKNKIG
jgi:hypothetical protein